MSTDTALTAPPAPTRRRRMRKVLEWLIGIVLFVVVLDLLGVNIIDWLQNLWDQIKAIPPGYLIAALHRPARTDVLRRRLVLRHPQVRVPRRGHALADRRRLLRGRGP